MAAGLLLAVVAFVVASGVLRNGGDSRLHLVALGDSYSAGVGLGEVIADDCDRDVGAYAVRVVQLLTDVLDLDSVEHVACSGAVIDDLVEPQRISRGDTVPPQLEAVTHDTDVVSLTIGGNDIDFAGKVVACLLGACGDTLMNVDPSSRDDPALTWELLAQRLAARYVDVRRAMDDDGSLFVLSYPIPFQIEGGTAPCAGFQAAEMAAANSLATRLGDAIRDATDAANAQLAEDGIEGNVRFVEWRVGERVAGGYTSPRGETFDFVDSPHGICSSEPYLLGFDAATLFTGDASNNFHPTAAGYEFAADALAAAVSDVVAGRT